MSGLRDELADALDRLEEENSTLALGLAEVLEIMTEFGQRVAEGEDRIAALESRLATLAAARPAAPPAPVITKISMSTHPAVRRVVETFRTFQSAETGKFELPARRDLEAALKALRDAVEAAPIKTAART